MTGRAARAAHSIRYHQLLISPDCYQRIFARPGAQPERLTVADFRPTVPLVLSKRCAVSTNNPNASAQ